MENEPGLSPPARNGPLRDQRYSMLLFDHVSYSYPARHKSALSDVSLSLEPGCRIALLGSNGSGKSTLARLANGLLLPDEGNIDVDGLSTDSQQTVRELRKLVGLVLQDPDNQIISSSVLDDVAFGPENLGLDRGEIERRCREALALVGLTGYERRDPNTLSGGEKQRLVIAGILAMEPRYVVLDEPTSMLDVTGRKEVRAAIDSLHDRGHGILHITHDLEEALDADLIVVLKQGRIVFRGTAEELMRDITVLADYGIGLTPLLRLQSLLSQSTVQPIPAREEQDSLTGEPLPGAARTLPEAREAAPTAHKASPVTGEILRLENVSFTYTPASPMEHQALSDVSMTVDPGSYLLVLGHTGSGKSTLLRIAAGLLKPDSGRAFLTKMTIAADRADSAISDGANSENTATAADAGAIIKPGVVGLVFQQPETQLFAHTVAEDICFGPRNLGMLGNAQQQDAVVRESLAAVGLDYQEFSNRSPFTLSGGESRRVALATVLAMRPRFLLLDEPTAGLDADGRRFVRALIERLTNQGVGVVVVSHDIDEFLPHARDVLILAQGKSVWSGSATELVQHPDLLESAGLQIPQIISWQQREGMPQESYTLDPEKAAKHILQWRVSKGES